MRMQVFDREPRLKFRCLPFTHASNAGFAAMATVRARRELKAVLANVNREAPLTDPRPGPRISCLKIVTDITQSCPCFNAIELRRTFVHKKQRDDSSSSLDFI